MKLSIAICTYNRCTLLENLLLSLESQVVIEDISYEVLVIDNNSSDSTPKITEKYFERVNNLKYIFEETQGLSHARNRAFKEAHGEYVAYLDDEVILPSRWVANVCKIIDKNHPAFFGGPYTAYFDCEKPKWFKKEYGSSPPRETGFLDQGYISGGNMVILKTVLSQMGGFNPELGMVGDTLAYAEEAEFQMRLRKEMPEALIFFSNEVVVSHLVRHEKFSIINQLKVSWANGKSSVYWDNKKNTSKFLSIIRLSRLFIKFVLTILFGLPFRQKIIYPYIHNYIYEVLAPYFTQMSKQFELLRVRY